MDTVDFISLKAVAEKETGFRCYEGQPGDQQVWYGTSDRLTAFQNLVGSALPTGSVAFLMDTGVKKFYSKYKNTWY